jgi:multidrug resistance protein, MATE family
MQSVSRAEERRLGGSGLGFGAELSATLALAAPLAAGNLAQMAMSVTTTVMVGRLGGLPLAAVGLGGMLYFTGGIILQGVLFAVSPLAAHALGAGDRGGAGRIAGAGLALAMMLALPFAAALVVVDHVLRALGYDAALAAEIGRYLRASAWGVPAFLSYAVLRSVLAALSHTRSIMTVHMLCLAGHAVLSWALIFGHLGAPALGVTGSGYASAAVQWLTLAGLGLCILLMPGLRGLHLLRAALAASRNEISRILRLGLPIGGMRGIETGLFLTTGVLVGLLGASTLAAHQLVLNCCGISFMVPLGLANAATVRVALQLGADRPEAARRAGFVALALGIASMLATAIVLWTVPGAIIGLYIDTGDPANHPLVVSVAPSPPCERR